MNQEQVKRLSTLVAAHMMSMCLDAACGDLFVTDDVKPEESASHGKGWPLRLCALM
jgi:hypothetical protein